MRKSRFSEEQIVAALQLVKSGGDVGEICRKLGVTRTTFYRWKSKYGGLGLSETKRPKQLEGENRRLKKIVADQTLDMQILKEVLAKNGEAHGEAAGRGPCAEEIRAKRNAV